jgi:hypothetical protein
MMLSSFQFELVLSSDPWKANALGSWLLALGPWLLALGGKAAFMAAQNYRYESGSKAFSALMCTSTGWSRPFRPAVKLLNKPALAAEGFSQG